ncbi:uncharacterized protein [Leptinotarsa decemlineata]|uniref:uncharacterized protein n=1 Tax=Leptinotarsa decemlineata TaxID=7539 RepID=UPI003D3096D5
MAPLTHLTKKEVKFEITPEVLQATEKLKSILTSDLVLIFPGFSQPFIVATDASGSGIGAVLSQLREGHERPVAYASRNLKKAELNYSTTEKELLGVIFGIQTFRCYLYGNKFTVITDHRPLKWLLTIKDPGSRLAIWALTLGEYDFTIIHRKGKLHGNADALSRMHDRGDHYIETEVEEYEEYRKIHQTPKMTKLKIKVGNLFSAPEEWALAHSVSRDFAMRDGIARQFKEIYGAVEILVQQERNVGEVAELRLPERNIYYLVTKAQYWDKPSYRSMWNALRELKNCCDRNKDTHLAMPRIGNGLDKLDWGAVLGMIEFLFHNTNIEIYIYELAEQVATIGVVEEREDLLVPEWDREELKTEQTKDEFCQEIERQNYMTEENPLYYRSKDELIYHVEEDGDKLIVPRKYVRKVLEDFHDAPFAGHPGQQKTLASIKRRFY